MENISGPLDGIITTKMLTFDLTKEVKTQAGKAFFKKYLDKTYKVLKKRVDDLLDDRDGHIDLVLIDNEQMHEMNKEYRSKDSPTDVISFAYLEVTDYGNEEGDIIVGDIFISVDTAKKQAKEEGHSLKEELAILFVHGLLHCLGFDHRNDEEEKEMESWAMKILK